MRFDMHCHTKEGSVDAKVEIISYIRRLKKMGYDGMLVTDHNSYKGYEAWKKSIHNYPDLRSFVVLKGIEYDTLDAGHFLVILPDDVHLDILEIRGMALDKLIKIVHQHGGILGPAHPFGNGYFAITNTKVGIHSLHLYEQFDFIETYNGCEKPFSNIRARMLAILFHKVHFSGSDSHKISSIGSAFTQFKNDISCNNDLIKTVKAKVNPVVPTVIGQTPLGKSLYKERNRIIQVLLNGGYWIYNRFFALLNLPRRAFALRKFRIYYK